MDLCFLVDISPFVEDLGGSCNAAYRAIASLLYKAVQENYSARWGYKFIDSRSEPHSFETRYKSVAGYADNEFPAGSPLAKGECSVMKHACAEEPAVALHRSTSCVAGGQDLEVVSPASIKRFMAVLDRLMDPAILSALATPFTGTCISHIYVLQHHLLCGPCLDVAITEVRLRLQMPVCRQQLWLPGPWAPALHPEVLCTAGDVLHHRQHLRSADNLLLTVQSCRTTLSLCMLLGQHLDT